MERQIPRSIQYSDLRPEVIENQIKLVRFTPQTNIQNQVPNDIVRFLLQGNGFYDPYSAYISMTVDFGEPAAQFMAMGTDAAANTGLQELQQMWLAYQNQREGQTFSDELSAEPFSLSANTIATNKTGCYLSDLQLDHQNIVVRASKDGYFESGLEGNAQGSYSYLQTRFDVQNDQPTAATIAAAVAFRTVVSVSSDQSIFNYAGTSCITRQSTAPFNIANDAAATYAALSPAQRTIAAMASRTLAEQKNAAYNGDGTQTQIPIPGAEFKILDRSAHSFINRLVIRSQGTEIERIEQYDVVCGFLNDMIYSNEQAQFHSFEGFGGTPLQQTMQLSSLVELERSCVANSVMGPRGRVGERIWGWAFVGVDEDNWLMSQPHTDLTYDLVKRPRGNQSAGVMQLSGVSGMSYRVHTNVSYSNERGIMQLRSGVLPDYGVLLTTFGETNAVGVIPYFLSGNDCGRSFCRTIANDQATSIDVSAAEQALQSLLYRGANINYFPYRNTPQRLLFGGFENHPIAWYCKRFNTSSATNYDYLQTAILDSLSSHSVNYFRPGHYKIVQLGQRTYEFAIPIYSGLIGVLMPEKKLLPLSLMPLEVDFTLNPHALIAVHSSGYGMRLDRFYTMKRMEIYSHMVFFEQDVHRSMESIVAENGLFIHMNTFYLAPVTLHGDFGVTQTIPINLHFKNINSIHLINLYTNYLTRPSVRKLHFVSHNITSLQIRNGTDLIPSEPLRMENFQQSSSIDYNISSGRSTRLFIELLKAYNKMHDPMCDVALDPGLVFLSDCYADASSDQAIDFKVCNGNETTQFTGENIPSLLSRRLFNLTGQISCPRKSNVLSPGGVQSSQVQYMGYITSPGAQADIGVLNADGITNKFMTISAARSVVRMARLGSLSNAVTQGTDLVRGVNPRGSWGTNPHHIANRPAIFYAPHKSTIMPANVQDGEYYGIPARVLKEKIQRFSACTGRCQIAFSLEGINLGTDNSLLCGKRGMIPFDIMVTGYKNDSQQSMSLVFAKCDFIVYIRPDLVVTVLGK